MKNFCLLALIFTSLLSRPSLAVLELAIMEYPPYEYQEQGKLKGVSVELVREVFKRLNEPINIQLLPLSRGLKYLKFGQIDGLFQILKHPERMAYAEFTEVALMEETVSLFALQNFRVNFDGNLMSLSALRFGVRDTFSYGNRFDRAVRTGVLTRVTSDKSTERLLMLLNRRRIDLVVGDTINIPYLYRKLQSDLSGLKLTAIKGLTPVIQSTPTYLAFSKVRQHHDLARRFDLILLEMKRDGSYLNILRDWRNRHSLKETSALSGVNH